MVQKRTMNIFKSVLMILLGSALLFFPGFTLVTVTQIVASLLIVKGMSLAIFLLLSRSAFRGPLLIFEVMVDLSIGFLILYNPVGTISFFIIILAIWALLGGMLMAFSFNGLRRIGIASWGLFINSIVALTFGLLLIFKPLRGSIALATIIGVFAFIHGVVGFFSYSSNR